MKMKKARNDVILYGFMIALSLLVYFWVIPSQIQMNAMAKAETFSPDTFPRFVTIIWILISSAGELNALRAYFAVKKEEGLPEEESGAGLSEKKQWIGKLIPYVFFLLAVIYGALFKILGFIPATVILIPVMLLVIGCRKWSYYVIVYAFVAFLYMLFRFVLHVPIH